MRDVTIQLRIIGLGIEEAACTVENDNWERKYNRGEDEMVGWHHQLNGHETEQTLEDSEGQGSLACCCPWGCKESDMT